MTNQVREAQIRRAVARAARAPRDYHSSSLSAFDEEAEMGPHNRYEAISALRAIADKLRPDLGAK